MGTYRVMFIGHRDINNFYTLEERLREQLLPLLMHKDFVDFFLGIHGDFDALALHTLKQLQDRFSNFSANLILPYSVSNMDLLSRQFDSVIIPEHLHHCYPKKAYTLRNQWMVDCCDLLLCYVTNKKGGAADALRYAIQKHNIQVKNLAE